MPDLTREDRITGCLLAGALGDAMGACFEGEQSGIPSAAPTDLHATDDTQLTLATCESIIQTGRIDPKSIADHFLRWYRERRLTGLGASTLKALRDLEVGGHWATAGATGERSAGNGAAMRVAPLAFFLDPNSFSDRRTIRDVCRITHRNEEAYVGALAVLHALHHVVIGNPLDRRLLTKLVTVLPDSRVRDRLVLTQSESLAPRQYARRFAASGYVVDSVPLAILAAASSVNLLDTFRQLMSFGGDTDTIASICGHIAGAAQGTTILPAATSQVDLETPLREIARKLSRV